MTMDGDLMRFDSGGGNTVEWKKIGAGFNEPHAAFGVSDAQDAFGDCGAFTCVNERRPAIEVQQAVDVYDLFGRVPHRRAVEP